MLYSNDDLRAAANAGLLTPVQVDPLLAFLGSRAASMPAPAPRFDVVHLLWYAGALIVITAMGLFSTVAFAQMGGWALTATAVIYAALLVIAGQRLWSIDKLRTPGGLLIAAAVSMAPLAIYGAQDALGLWGQFGKPGTTHDFYVWIKGSWVFMEAGAVAAAALALYFFRFPFIVLMAAFALWFMSMDIVPWITGTTSGNWDIARKTSIWFGLGILAAAVVVNMIQRKGDFAFWLYLFGVLTFWGGITASSEGSTLDKGLYCAMNVGFLFLAAYLGRRVFAVFGTIGIAIYLGDLAQKMFKDSLLFPFALSLIGIAIIGLGLWYFRHQEAVVARFERLLPDPLKRLRPANAAG